MTRCAVLALAWVVGCSAPIPGLAPSSGSKAHAPQDAAVVFAEELITPRVNVACCVGYYGRLMRVRVLASGEIVGGCTPQ